MFKHYLITAWKVFTRRKLYTAINLMCIVLTLTVLMFVTTVQQYTFYPSGVEGRSDRFLQIDQMEWLNTKTHDKRVGPLGYKTISTYLKTLKTPVMVSAAGFPQMMAAYQDGQVLNMTLRRGDAEYFKILDFKVVAGRQPNDADQASGRLVLLLSESRAVQLFGSAQAAVGRKLTLGATEFEVIGVAEDAAHINSVADAWAPLSTMPSTAYREQLEGGFSALLLARSADDFPAIQAEVEEAAKRYQFEDPNAFQKAYFWADSKLDVYARSTFERMEERDSGARQFLGWHVFWMIVFMLLPALNLVNMNAGRVAERAVEIGVRKAFGATNGQLVMQFVAENVLLCLLGGVIAWGAAYGILATVVHSGLIPGWKVLPPPTFVVFACAMVIATVFGLISGALPAWKMARLDPVHALKGVA